MSERFSIPIRTELQARKRPAKIYRLSELRAKRAARQDQPPMTPLKPAAAERKQTVEQYRWSKRHIMLGMAAVIIVLLVSAFQYVI